MSAKSCSACNDLRSNAPEFTINGVTDEACESLAMDKGLNPDLDPQRTDCDDLHDINDCLIGNMDDEVESFDVCEWKDFMHQYIPNTYETLKAMICSDCGQWDMLHELCRLLGHVISPPTITYGVLPLTPYTERRVGAIPSKNGTPALVPIPCPYDPVTDKERYDAFARNQGAGIAYAKEEIVNCETGECEIFEWIYPNVYLFKMSANVAIGDVIWYAHKDEWQAATGWTNFLWHNFVLFTYTWSEIPVMDGTYAGKYVHFQIKCNPGNMGDDYIGIVFTGTSYPSQALGVESRIDPPTAAERLYRHACELDEQY